MAMRILEQNLLSEDQNTRLNALAKRTNTEPRTLLNRAIEEFLDREIPNYTPAEISQMDAAIDQTLTEMAVTQRISRKKLETGIMSPDYERYYQGDDVARFRRYIKKTRTNK